jgi:hypothetical protein
LVRMLKMRGYAADHGTGADGRIAFLTIVLAGAKDVMASEASMRVSSVGGLHVKRHSPGVEGVTRGRDARRWIGSGVLSALAKRPSRGGGWTAHASILRRCRPRWGSGRETR